MSIISEIVQQLNKDFKVDIAGAKRTMMNSIARKAMVNALRNKYTTIELGHAIGRKHSTICHYMVSHQYDYKMHFYKDVYLTTQLLYKNLVDTPPVSHHELNQLLQEVKSKLLIFEKKMKAL